MVHTHKKG